MENNNNLLDWQQEVMPETVKRIQREHEKQKEVADKLARYKVVRQIQEGVAIGLTTAVILAGIVSIRIKNENDSKKSDSYTISEVNTDTVTLTKYYTVEFGDTLSAISSNTGIPQSKIEEDNSIDNGNMIYLNQVLKLNYCISPEDLDYYTQSVNVNGRNIFEIAAAYDTNIQTIEELNGEAIVNNGDGTYTILSTSVLVPNFITQAEYKELKANQK